MNTPRKSFKLRTAPDLGSEAFSFVISKIILKFLSTTSVDAFLICESSEFQLNNKLTFSFQRATHS